MSHWESIGKSSEWFTPIEIFNALEVDFDLDVAAPIDRKFCCVPSGDFITDNSLKKEWNGFVWMNPPFGGRNGIVPWLNRIIDHGNGIALTPDRSSTTWWQTTAALADSHFQIHGKVKFVRPDGTRGKQPSHGTTLFAFGDKAVEAFCNAEKNNLGIHLMRFSEFKAQQKLFA